MTAALALDQLVGDRRQEKPEREEPPMGGSSFLAGDILSVSPSVPAARTLRRSHSTRIEIDRAHDSLLAAGAAFALVSSSVHFLSTTAFV